MAIIRQTFFQECDEQLVELEAGLLSIEAGTHDDETVNAVFRAVHSIKGGAGAFNLNSGATNDLNKNPGLVAVNGVPIALARSSEVGQVRFRVQRDF